MKSFSFFTLICFILLHKYKINSLTSFLIDKHEDDNLLADKILEEIKEDEKEVLGTETNILEKNDFSFDHNKINCEEIKKLGQQKTFCKKKISSNDKKELSSCIKSFCKICCEGGDETCDKNCSQSHSLFPDHDPEEMLLSVCSLKNMTDSFQSVCDTLLTDKKADDYTECFSNTCYDCCSNELSITDFKDSKMKKCLLSCTKRVHIEKKLIITKRDSPATAEKSLVKIEKTVEKETIPTKNSYAKELVLSPENRQKENFKICGKLILSQKKSMTKDFGQKISALCKKNYNTYNFISSDGCLDDLCLDCCKILDEEMNIKACIFQCQKNSNKIPSINSQPITVKNEEPKQIKSSNNGNNVPLIIEEKNIFNFNLIKSICDVKYFKDCHESLCNDFCRQSYNLLDSDCVLNCDNHMKKNLVKNEFIEHIIKTHQKFEIKMENVSRIEKSPQKEDIEKSTAYTGIDSTIEKSKEKIKILKDKLLEEEKNLLNMYKIKWK